MPATYEPIATTTLGSAAATINFTSIAATYTDLRLVLVSTTSASTSVRFRFNSDTASNYSRTYLIGDGTTATSGANSNAVSINSPIVSSNLCMTTMDVFSYSGSTNKTCLITFGDDANGSGNVVRQVGLWRSTSAITEINLFVGSGNYNAGTTATLYGIKNA